ncbi:MAG: DMT family transporter [Chloroflexota bacterium]
MVHEATDFPQGGVSDRPKSSLPWQSRILLLAAIWGSSFVLIKFGDQSFAPLQIALGRLAFGTAILLVIVAIRREALPRGVVLWFQLAVAALVSNALPFTLFAYGETRTTSILAGIANATTPLFTLLVAMAVLADERPDRARVAGLVLGFLGVLVVFGIWSGLGGNELIGNLACLGAAVSYGFSFPFMRRYLARRPESAISLVTGQLICGTIEIAIITPFFTSMPASISIKSWVSVIILGALGTGIAFVLNYGLIRDIGATMASIVTYIVPLFATVEGALVLGERITWNEPVGALIVILGVAITQGRVTPARWRHA